MPSGIGIPGLILILILALLLFGPNKLPELGRAFGRTLREFKAGARDVMRDDEDNKGTERKEVSSESTVLSSSANVSNGQAASLSSEPPSQPSTSRRLPE
ncbi:MULTISPECIES: twin-arginine translocase TatA/TatE family subunit [Paenibacillus]|uniref:Sec-independent protein translocase protein TatA n=1 Tax=Paenibacillus arenosi TaxID=2774142 RepID=A0ABR9AVY7_9BACL|nr:MULTISPECIES: twin-arginine translocase TatA/TatE family subunit [Paenibacillus]MBD8498298.1 twin-arginine translocase TatA/TatE family subunit [Paenibacillus arenosi]